MEDHDRILNLMPWLFDKCLFSMVPFDKGKDIESYEFGLSPFWLRVYNIPIELMDRKIALAVGKAIGELVVIDWKDFRKESQTNIKDDSGQPNQLEKEKRVEKESISNLPVEKRSHKLNRDNMGCFKQKRKRMMGWNGENHDESLSKSARRRLMENVSPLKAVAGMGGLGIRELRLFNVALLGRQGDVFQPKSIDKPSFTWKSIAKAAQELYDGFGWTIGNDKSIKIWHDNWGFEGLLGQSICLDKRLVKEEYVCDFSMTARMDGTRISFRSGFDDTCLRCGKERETLIHKMKDCLLAHTVLEYGGLNHKFLVGNYSNCIDCIEDMRRELDCKAVSDLITILWNIWNCRKNRIFKGLRKKPK
ncbi:hypothetical protein PVK06_026974 [Gossypium arboreum]|uniref:DUF4283 domain-containing protein n=1 Tax=Gossypium arboreum TaxID=29729 RepID=A0ABR0NZE5_GOSAR|nr:hypothetical protein PVK06_026974 [Gossypium arboreum]